MNESVENYADLNFFVIDKTTLILIIHRHDIRICEGLVNGKFHNIGLVTLQGG